VKSVGTRPFSATRKALGQVLACFERIQAEVNTYKQKLRRDVRNAEALALRATASALLIFLK
jgi:molecular chaperone GrpE (heat shock protein)